MRFSILLASLICLVPAYAQFVATVEVKEPVPGICNDKHVYALLNFLDGQKEHTCDTAKTRIEELLNERVTYLKENPKFKLKKYESVSTWVSCEGKLVKVDLDSKSPQFNEQVIAVFLSLSGWHVGTMGGKSVDSVRLWGIEVKKGRIVLD
jgi:hypothetical protein